MFKIVCLALSLFCASGASASVLDCRFEIRCSSLKDECGDEPLNILADFSSGSLEILESGNTFSALIIEDRVMPFRSLAVVDGQGAISILSVHEDNSAVYTYQTGLHLVGAIWSSASGNCKDAN
jgi:hypothetical protein